jgi:hypothetical protein
MPLPVLTHTDERMGHCAAKAAVSDPAAAAERFAAGPHRRTPQVRTLGPRPVWLSVR